MLWLASRTITLDWRDVLNIVLAIVAILQYLRRRKIKEASDEALQRQARQTAAHGFAEMAREAYDLEIWIQKDAADLSIDLTKRLIVSLATGIGSWSTILDPQESDNADAARSEIMAVEKALPGAQGALTPERKEELRNRCVTASTLLAEIAGRLKRPDEVGVERKVRANNP